MYVVVPCGYCGHCVCSLLLYMLYMFAIVVLRCGVCHAYDIGCYMIDRCLLFVFL